MSEPACCRGDSRESVIGAHMGTDEVLHDVDCPMTNSNPKDRTVCVCDTDGPGGPRERTEPEGGAS